ncbi:MAG TPA: DUF1707 domain-containing protein [Actinocrinis sp.]|nr:DUF1707 domain-containing protein [Actinocrinis sp.]
MTPQNFSSGRQPDPANLALRASDQDRDHVAQLVNQAFAEGRLSPEEHTERLEAIYTAKTLGDLRPLVADLPVTFAPPSSGMVADAPVPGANLPFAPKSTDNVMAVFGENKRTGRWLVRSGLVAQAVFGSVELDLTEAVLEQREVTITANVLFGEVKIRVPDGVMLVDEGTAIFGSRKLGGFGTADFGPETPVVRVRGFVLFGNVEAKRPRRKWFK